MVTITLGNKTVELDLDRDMRLTDETLEEDMCELARRVAFYAELYGETKAEAMRAEAELKFQASKAAQNIRETSPTRVTEPAIKELVRLKPEVREAKELFFRATAQATMVEGFYRALRDKVNLGIAICYKQKEEIRVTGSPVN